jgi:F420-dependent methylenetetrahydromethanopterin dehydrogenase
MIEQAVPALLLAATGVTSVVGNRIDPLVIPQADPGKKPQMPRLVYQVITRERSKDRCGTVDLVRTSMQIDAYGKTYAQAKAAAAACVAALLDYRGTVSGVTIKDVALSAEIDLMDPEPGLFRVSNTFEIWHTPR